MSKSGIDMLSDILREITLLRKEVKVLDQNIKKIANSTKVAEIAAKALNTPLKDWIKPNAPRPKIEAATKPKPGEISQKNMRFKFETVDASKTKQEAPNRSSRVSDKKCICEGNMVAEYSGKTLPLPGLDVKIFDDRDNLVKETKTNRGGKWMSQLGPGNYVANIEGNFQGKPLYPININFVVKPGMKKLEVK